MRYRLFIRNILRILLPFALLFGINAAAAEEKTSETYILGGFAFGNAQLMWGGRFEQDKTLLGVIGFGKVLYRRHIRLGLDVLSSPYFTLSADRDQLQSRTARTGLSGVALRGDFFVAPENLITPYVHLSAGFMRIKSRLQDPVASYNFTASSGRQPFYQIGGGFKLRYTLNTDVTLSLNKISIGGRRQGATQAAAFFAPFRLQAYMGQLVYSYHF